MVESTYTALSRDSMLTQNYPRTQSYDKAGCMLTQSLNFSR